MYCIYVYSNVFQYISWSRTKDKKLLINILHDSAKTCPDIASAIPNTDILLAIPSSTAAPWKLTISIKGLKKLTLS